MGMFDELVPFSEHFKEGVFFTLLDVKKGNEIDTVHGEGTPVQLKIKTEDKPGGEWFSAFGQALSNQVDRVDPSDLPAEVAMVRQSNKAGSFEYKVLATRAQVEEAAAA